ncbi:sulfotransferase [Glacieibacterium sp.]|uniref:tetratricopeptide repeat-containing sulfotransferase family protein n=1 Tax=Glacieibacterium sp. TaxID=2860237 RepID=UPI003B00AD9F
MSISLQRGIAAAHARDPRTAAQWFRRALAESPSNAAAEAWLGQALCALGERLAGTRHLAKAGRAMLAAPSAQTPVRLVEILSQLQQWGDVPAALDLARAATAAYPDHARLQQLLAVACSQLNDPRGAVAAGAEALRLAPGVPMLEVLQASLEIDAGDLDAARPRLDAVLAGPDDAAVRLRAHKELARLDDRQGRFDEAFDHLEAAGRAAHDVADLARHDRKLLPRLIAANTGAYDAAALGRWTGKTGATRPAPVFLIGFLRSGTTLVQAVLSAHPQVFVADEGNMLHDVLAEVQQRLAGPGSIATKLARLNLAQVEQLRALYWSRARGRYGDSIDRPVFVDKFTMSSVDVAAINVLFPDARIIYMLRDPRDVCLSGFQQLMVPTAATVHLLEWRSTAQLYAAVTDWWLHIRDTLTMPWLELRYEDVVGDFQPSLTRLLDFIGLDWDAALLDFHVGARAAYITSPSRSQVARPLYRSSAGRWRGYARHFAAVDDLLSPLVERLGYAP